MEGACAASRPHHRCHFFAKVAMKTVLSRRYLELLAGKLAALLFHIPFQLIEVERLCVVYRTFLEPRSYLQR